MTSSTARIIAAILLALVGGSFLSLLLRASFWFPVVLFSVATSLSLTRGFRGALPTVIAIGVLADLASAERIGTLAFFSVGAAYAAGFFSRRFAVEHGIAMYLFAGIVTGAVTVAYLVASPLFSGSPMVGVGWGTVVRSVFAGIAVFPAVSILLRRLEAWLSYFDPAGTY